MFSKWHKCLCHLWIDIFYFFIWNLDDFTFLCNYLPWIGCPILCWIEVVKSGILFLFLILEGKFLVSTIGYDGASQVVQWSRICLTMQETHVGLTTGSGRSPGVGNSTPLQYSSWIIPWREALCATVHGVAKSSTRLSDWTHMHTWW